MAGFKRNSNRFQSGGSSGGEARSSGGGGRSYGNGGGNRSGGREVSSGSGTKAKGNFIRVGSLTVPKSKANDERLHDLLAELNDMGAMLNASIYLPKGANSITLRNKDRLLVSFKLSEFDTQKDFYIAGSVSMPRDNGSQE